jgi:hypothetical protein
MKGAMNCQWQRDFVSDFMGIRLLLCPISGKNDGLLFTLISHRK